MSSQEELANALKDVGPCHFPSLLHDRDLSPAYEKVSTILTSPKVPGPSSTATEVLSEDDLWKLAFALLLKTYIRDDTATYGLLYDSDGIAGAPPTPPGRPTSTSHLLKAVFNNEATLLDNCRQLSSIPLNGGDKEEVERALADLEYQVGFKHFNTTLRIMSYESDHHHFENVFSSDLVLCVESGIPTTDSHDQIRVTLTYSTNLLNQWCAHNVLSTFESILSTISVNIDSPLKSVDVISTRDEQIIHEWNAKLPPPVHETLNKLYEKSFHDNADKEVVYTTEGSFTYRELDDLSTVLAVRLMKLGLKPNMVVPVCMNKSRWGTCAMAAVWKAGGSVTTMDPAHPDDRLFAIIEELRATIVISDAAHASRFSATQVHVVSNLETLPQLLEAEGLPVPRTEAWRMSNVKPCDLAMVAFTSGSSGRPKGVLHTHDRLTSEHQSYSWNVEYNGGARILQFASYAYITGVGENQRCFLHGATLCVPSEEERTSNLAEFINRSRATRSYLTPSVVRTLNPKDVPSLKVLCVGGELIGKDLEDIWAPHVNFIQIYGASEGGFMVKDRSSSTHNGKGLFPVGGLSWLVDPEDVNKLVPVGAVGEIVFESHELAAGYLNDPEKTARTFIDPPIWAQKRAAATGCRHLRNGDMGRYETDGSLSIYGRADTQVKIHGQRVELEDVESNLRILLPPGSAAVVELVRPFDAPDRPVLTAFCRIGKDTAAVGDSGADPVSRKVVSDAEVQLGKVLPRHMIPKAFIIVDQIPGSYKIDRRKLRTEASKLGFKGLIALSRGQSNSGHSLPPANDKERTLARLWSKVIRQDVKSLGREDDFFALGGDSLAAIRLVSMARSEGLKLTTQDILSHPMLEDMAELVTALNKTLEDNATVSNGTQKDTIAVRATDFQEWAALVGALNGGWIDHFVYDFSGRLDSSKLEQSCRELVEAHSILRSIFKLSDDRIFMEIVSGETLRFEAHEATLDQLEQKSKEIYDAYRVSPLGIPIIRFDLIKTSPNRHRLIMKLSHAQYDGFCAAAFGQHLRLLYTSQSLPDFLQFHEYLKQVHDHNRISNAEGYWRTHLKGSQMPRLVERGRSGPPFTNTLDGEFKRLASIPSLRNLGINTAIIVKAAWALTIASLSNATDIVFGDFVSGRQVPIPNIETVVGPCVNFMPLRVRVAEGLTNLELLREVQRDLISAIPYESLGFRHIIQNCTDWGADERYSSIVNFVNIDEADVEKETWVDGDQENRLEVDSIYEEKQHDKTDLWLLCRPARPAAEQQKPGTTKDSTLLELSFRYNISLYQDKAITRIADLYLEALSSLVTSLDLTVRVPQALEVERSLLIPTCD